jgi:serine/threonine protein kinase, bacterial
MPPGSLAPDFDRGRRIGKYEILTRLSMGGMAELFLAYVAGPGGFRKYVAVKQILPDIKKDESFVKMFLDEARITAAFSHSNIGQVYDLGEDQGEFYLAMEFLSGQNLEQIIKRAAKREVLLPVGFACRVVRDSVLGLHYAHHFTDQAGRAAPVIHRDVSPKNVMVTYTGDVKMIDFGIAKARNRLNRTQVGIVKGTSGYMSPEQVKNETLDGRTDLFAAAVFLHEMLTAQRLFTAPTDAAMMLKIVEGEIQLPKNLNPKVPGGLSDVVMKGLSRKRENRFATGKEFAKAIEQACPEMFDEDQSAALMTQLFDDKIQTTRALLELANSNDTGSLTKAVQELASEDLESSTPKGRKLPPKATPAPRPGLPKKATLSKQNLRPVVDEPVNPPRRNSSTSNRDVDATMPPKSRAHSSANLGANRYASKVGRDYAMYDEPEVPTDTSSAKKPLKSSRKLPVVVTGDGTDTHRGVVPKKAGFGGVVVLVLFAGLLGGAVWAGWKGPLKDLGPAIALRAMIDKELNGAPIPPPPPSLEEQAKIAGGNKPAWVIAKEQEDAIAKEDADRRAEAEAAANDPERKAMLAELDSQIKQLDKLEDEQRTLKIEAKNSKAVGASNSKRIDDLEKQISELKGSIETKKAKKAKQGDGAVEVVRDSKSAKALDIGYLSLRTVNPSEAAVYDGNMQLGSTPLVKVPLDEGVHKLRLVDGDSKNRILSVKIEGGKTMEIRAVDVQSLPLQ